MCDDCVDGTTTLCWQGEERLEIWILIQTENSVRTPFMSEMSGGDHLKSMRWRVKAVTCNPVGGPDGSKFNKGDEHRFANLKWLFQCNWAIPRIWGLFQCNWAIPRNTQHAQFYPLMQMLKYTFRMLFIIFVLRELHEITILEGERRITTSPPNYIHFLLVRAEKCKTGLIYITTVRFISYCMVSSMKLFSCLIKWGWTQNESKIIYICCTTAR